MRGRPKLTTEEIKTRLDKANIDLLEDYKGISVKHSMSCRICNHKWVGNINGALKNGNCPKCGERIRSAKLKKSNIIIEDNGDWLLIDISTKKHPNATMAVDHAIWIDYINNVGFRIFPALLGKGIYGMYKESGTSKLFHHYVLPKKNGMVIDHINPVGEDFIDNRSSNLRYATHSANHINCGLRKDNKSGFTGIHKDKYGKYTVYITKNKAYNYLGYCDTKEDAIALRKKWEKELFGEFAPKGEIR